MSKKQNWQKNHSLTPEKLDLAREVLAEVRQGSAVMDSVRKHPIPSGGYLGKHVLVAAYNQMVEAGRNARGRAPAGTHPLETGAYALRA